MSYHPSIPQASDNPTNSQQDLLDNFSAINSRYAVNHVPLTVAQNAGFHTLVEFNDVQATDPTVTGTQSALYPKSVNGDPQLFFENAVNIAQLTGIEVINGTITNVVPGGVTTISVPTHGLVSGQSIIIAGVTGITGGINGGPFVVTVLTVGMFTIPLATGGAYISGGVIYTQGNFASNASYNVGFVSPWGFTFNMGKWTPFGFGTQNLKFAVPFTTGFNLFTVQLTPVAFYTAYNLLTITNTTLNFYLSAANPVYYIAIGE